jgi:transcriptional repressor NrdR
VADSRLSREANAIRRRREAFNRSKIYEGIKKACQKRPVSIDDIEQFLDRLERELQESGRKEIPSTLIGEKVMNQLHQWDDVAFVRFASVYRHFSDITEFMEEINKLAAAKDTKKAN